MDTSEAYERVYAGAKVRRPSWVEGAAMILSAFDRPIIVGADGQGLPDPIRQAPLDPAATDWEEVPG